MPTTSLAPLAFFFTTWWSALAVAGAAASVPIIIHLLNRRRFRVVVWAAMRFLLAAQKQNTRRMRLEQLILLAVRTLAVLLVVLAMASVMPWAEAFWNKLWPGGAGRLAARAGRTHKVLVLDGSLSMVAKKKGDDKSCFERAKDRAVEIVEGSARGDSFSVVLMAGAPRRVGAKPSPNRESVVRQLRELLPPHGNADVPATLATVEQIYGESAGKFEATEVYFLTDLQRATWAPERSRAPAAAGKGKPAEEGPPAEPARKFQQKALTVFVDVGIPGVDNLAVTGLRVEEPFVTTGKRVRFTATVKNYGSRPRAQARVELLVQKAGRTPPGQRFAPWRPHPAARAALADLGPNEEVEVPFEYHFKDPGEYAVQARLTPDDLTPDDSRAVIVTVKKSVPVLLVDGKPGRDDPFEGAAEYLSKALNPAIEGPAPADMPLLSRVVPRVIPESRFADLRERDLEPYDCIFFCDVERPAARAVRLLKYHLRRGGGVVFCLGPQSAGQLERYNRLLYEGGRGILPARLRAVQKAPADHYFGFDLGKAAFREPPLRVFDSDDGRLTLRQVRFHRYVRATVPPRLNARAVLSFVPGLVNPDKKLDKGLPNGDPAILLWQPVLPPEKKEGGPDRPPAPRPATPALYRGRIALVTTSVNMDWTTWPASPGYLPLMQELLRLAIAGRLREQSAVVGDVLEEYLQAVAQKDARVYVPGRGTKDARTELTEEASVFRWADTDVSGVYRVTIGADPLEHLFAVNVPTTTAGQKASESDFGPPRCDLKALQEFYPSWRRVQVVRRPADVDPSLGAEGARSAADEEGEPVQARIGPLVAWWALAAVLALLLTEVVLAWRFGHYSAAAGTHGDPPAVGRKAPGLVGVVAGVLFVVVAGTLIHAKLTGDFLGFLPEGVHGSLEQLLDIPKAKEGESNTWQLEALPLFGDGQDDLWLGGALAVAAAALVVLIYLREGRTAGTGYKLLLAGLRVSLILLALAVLWPQLQLRFERRLWPDLVVFLDDSGSMGEGDEYQTEEVRDAAYQLTQKLKKDLQNGLPKRIESTKTRLEDVNRRLQEQEDRRARRGGDAGLDKEIQALRESAYDLAAQRNYFTALRGSLESGTWRPSRLQLAWAVLTLREPDWIKAVLARRKMKVYVYHLDRSGQTRLLGDVTGLHEVDRHKELIEKIKALRAEARLTPLDAAVHKILGDFSTSSLGAVILLTDGITVPGQGDARAEGAGPGKDADPLVRAARYAGAKGVPLFFVGVGDAHGNRDIRLLSMDAPHTVHVKDTIEFQVTLQGHKEATVPLHLYERDRAGNLIRLQTKNVTIDPKRGQMTVRLRHQPAEVGEKVYVVRLDVPRSPDPKKQPREDYLQLQRKVMVEEARLVKVLYIDGTPRYEFRYPKTLLEREAAEDVSNKTVDLNVVLLDADDDFAKEDKSALVDIPAKADLFKYDVVILGDCDPQHPKLRDHLRDLADFVRERGGGFLMVAGENFSPNAYRDTPLHAILPIEVVREEPPPEDEDRTEGYRPVLTPEGLGHELFRFGGGDEGERLTIWNNLPEMYWWADGYRTKPAARVLAVHPTRAGLEKGRPGEAGGGKLPLVVYQLVGSGRSMFYGFDETWRWRFRENELYFNQFWMNTVDFLARSRPSRTDLVLNKQTPYTRGEVIQVTVRFPDSQPPPPEVKVEWQRTPPAQGGLSPAPEPKETLTLTKVEEAWGTYRGRLSRTREGKYRFKLKAPVTPAGQEPTAECLVVPPEGELERLSMNEAGMREAARASGGKFFTLADADQVLDQIPEGGRIEMDRSRPPALLWNHPALFVLVMFLLGAEWLLRKRKHLL